MCQAHGLTPDQVVAIASHGGGKQALETVLCQAHGLTPDQVVAIAGHGGGKQALETVQRLLPALCQAHGLTLTRSWPLPAMGAASRRWRRCSGCCRCCARPMA
ncbi:hypothetical protein [Xanthomonas oryzae]|uniref:hypothetical protein n=1 Tax=Xanthomonas oryzae TaxID=347 RepID=UPI0031F335C6